MSKMAILELYAGFKCRKSFKNFFLLENFEDTFIYHFELKYGKNKFLKPDYPNALKNGLGLKPR